MEETSPPNPAVAELISAMGEDNVRTLVRSFLREFPISMQQLAAGDRKTARRVAHRMKSEFRMMGALDLSRRMLELQERLTPETGEELHASDLTAIHAEFEDFARTLQGFVGS